MISVSSGTVNHADIQKMNKKLEYITPYTKDWWKLAGEEAINFVGKVYPCAKCGYPVMSHYCCTRCGDVNPSEKQDE